MFYKSAFVCPSTPQQKFLAIQDNTMSRPFIVECGSEVAWVWGVLPAHSAAGCPVVFKSRPSKFVCVFISPHLLSSIDSEEKHVQEGFLTIMLSATWLPELRAELCRIGSPAHLWCTTVLPLAGLQTQGAHCCDLRGHFCENMVKVLCPDRCFFLLFFHFVSLKTQHELMVTQVGVTLCSWAECMARTPESGL